MCTGHYPVPSGAVDMTGIEPCKKIESVNIVNGRMRAIRIKAPTVMCLATNKQTKQKTKQKQTNKKMKKERKNKKDKKKEYFLIYFLKLTDLLLID